MSSIASTDAGVATEGTPKIRLKLSLRMARLAAHKTAGEAATAVGKSRQAVSAWERLDESAPVPDATDLAKLAKFYGTTSEAIRRGGDTIGRYQPGDSGMSMANVREDAGFKALLADPKNSAPL